MTKTNPVRHPATYEVGYARPPLHTRFRRGQSGNPRGRPRRTTPSFEQLILNEAYRKLTVREGANVVEIPAFQAVLRSTVTAAAKGNGPAQRLLVTLLQAAHSTDPSRLKPADGGGLKVEDMSPREKARRIAFILAEAGQQQKKEDERKKA